MQEGAAPTPWSFRDGYVSRCHEREDRAISSSGSWRQWATNTAPRPDREGLVMRFPLGQVVTIPGALRALQKAEQSPTGFLDRHANGDQYKGIAKGRMAAGICILR